MDADLVRLILLLLGASLVVGIWIWDRRKRQQDELSWQDEPTSVEDADEILGLRPVAGKPAATPQDFPEPELIEPDQAEPEDEPLELPSVSLGASFDADDEPEPDIDDAPPLAGKPAWMQGQEPVIPAFVMQADSPAEAVSQEEDIASVEPVQVEPEATPALSRSLEVESELAWMPDSQARTEFTPPLREDSEPLLHHESSFLAEDDHEPELPVLELTAEPIDAPRPKKPKSKKTPEPAEADKPDPLSIRMDEDQFDLELGFTAVDEQDLAEAAADLPQLIVSINVVAKRGQPFTGEQILAAMDQVEMKAGEHDIYHRYDNRLRDKQGRFKTLFSMASLVEPGNFPVRKMKDFSTPGLTLFTQLPGPRDGLVVYSDMLYVAERLARLLDAKLKDETRSALTKQTIEHTRSRIAEHKRQITLKLRESNTPAKGRR